MSGWLPEHFLFGVATAAHQIEGGNVNNDWWAFEHDPGSGCAEPSGDACDSWDRWGTDLDLVAAMGLNAYRFSIEWSRVEPEPGEYSFAALDHYRRIVEGCHERGLVSVVTLHHFTLPRWMADRGGFGADEVVDRLAAYAERVGAAMGDGIGLCCTINEPNIVALQGYLLGVFPPGVRDRGRFEDASARLRRAHHAMAAALRSAGSFPVGMTLAMAEMEAAEGGESQCARALEHMEDAYLREVHDDDFLGVQTYTRVRFGPDGPLRPAPGVRATKMGYEWRPEALEHTVRRAAAVAGVPIVVTEFGLSTDVDAERCEYLDASFEGIKACICDGLDIRGIFHWTLQDNFEWSAGYSQRFGLVDCDRTTFERREKGSARHLGELVQRWRSPIADAPGQ